MGTMRLGLEKRWRAAALSKTLLYQFRFKTAYAAPLELVVLRRNFYKYGAPREHGQTATSSY